MRRVAIYLYFIFTLRPQYCRCRWHTFVTNQGYFDYRKTPKTPIWASCWDKNDPGFGISLVYLCSWPISVKLYLNQLYMSLLTFNQNRMHIVAHLGIGELHPDTGCQCKACFVRFQNLLFLAGSFGNELFDYHTLTKLTVFDNHNIRLYQNNVLVPVTRLTLAQNMLNCRLNTFLRASTRNWNHGDSWNEIVKVGGDIFQTGTGDAALGVHGFHLEYPKLITRSYPKARNVPFHL